MYSYSGFMARHGPAKQLDGWLEKTAEAEKRDHRKPGRELIVSFSGQCAVRGFLASCGRDNLSVAYCLYA